MLKIIASIFSLSMLASGCVCISDSYFPYSQCPHYKEETSIVEEERVEEHKELKFSFPFRPLASQRDAD